MARRSNPSADDRNGAAPGALPGALPAGARIAAVLSTYHADLTRAMLASARRTLEAAGLDGANLLVVEVAGAFELPLVARRLAARDDVLAVLCFGLVLKGETSHDVHIAEAAARGILQVSLEADKPVLFGVLTCDTLEQARERASGPLDKGAEVAHAALAALAALGAARELGGLPQPMGFQSGSGSGGGA
jgi:6,7-dimethyl-8-ribityllumazine synthase